MSVHERESLEAMCGDNRLKKLALHKADRVCQDKDTFLVLLIAQILDV